MSGERSLRIGPFSRAVSLSVKALRAYHESGLLVPAEIDPRTGYRSYSMAQLADATVIRRLRELDVPLDAVRQVLDARDPEVTRKVLADHGTVLEVRLAATQRAIDGLYEAMEAPSFATPVHRRVEPSRTVLALTATIALAEWLPFLDRTRRLLAEAADVSGAVVDGAFGAAYPTLLDDDAQDVEAFLPVVTAPVLPAEARAAGVRVGELPATDVAVLAHLGSYDTVDDSYRRLGAWVAEHAVPADLPVREIYLVNAADTDDADEFRTEICWPVIPAG